MLYNKVLVELVSVYGLALRMVCYCIMSNKRLTEISVDQQHKSQSMDWDKCIFCQDNKDKALHWPLGTKRSDIDPIKTYGKAAPAI